MAAAAAPAQKAYIIQEARGFVPGRQLLANAVDLCAYARVAGWASWANHPILIFWDFLAAFPSVAQRFLFLLLPLIGVPQGFVNFVIALYNFNRCVHATSGAVLFVFLAGILQGCPLSGLLFTIIANGFFKR